jgi:hypothetical protein
MDNSIYDNFLLNTCIFAVLIVFGLFLSVFSKLSQAYLFHTLYLGFALFVLIGLKTCFENNINVYSISHPFLILRFLLLSLFYYFIIKNGFQRKIIICSVILIPIILFVQYLMQPNLFFVFNLLEIVLTTIPLILFGMFYFYNSIGKTKKYYYVNYSLVIYQTGNFILFLAANLYLFKFNILSLTVMNINSALSIICSCFVFWDWKVNFYNSKNNKNE